ncbi:MAG: FHA domain-containing protein [Chloroflexi bacterium]|nr:FHA domain-containing protein [Chloroflexota bacterium]
MSDFPFDPPPASPSGLSAELVLERGPTPDTRFVVTAVTHSIGRSPNNEIVINDPEISRRHAQIVPQGNQFAIEDLGSTNGTFVNGQRCAGLTPLKDGDVVELGDTIGLRFVQAAAAAHTPSGLDDEDTADLPPIQPPAQQPLSAVKEPPAEPYPNVPPADQIYETPRSRSTQLVLGCGLAFVLLICCCGTLGIFLDSYNGGQYLYCGELRPFWETTLGPLGFNPLCP